MALPETSVYSNKTDKPNRLQEFATYEPNASEIQQQLRYCLEKNSLRIFQKQLLLWQEDSGANKALASFLKGYATQLHKLNTVEQLVTNFSQDVLFLTLFTQKYQELTVRHHSSKETTPSHIKKPLIRAFLGHSEKQQDNIDAFLATINDYFYLKDPLTLAWKREARDSYCLEQIERKKTFAFTLIDLDNFKTINDWYGHDAGDVALQIFTKTVQEAIRTHFRQTDLLFRLGGDEFMIVFVVDKIDENTLKTLTEEIDSVLEENKVQFQKQVESFLSTKTPIKILSPGFFEAISFTAQTMGVPSDKIHPSQEELDILLKCTDLQLTEAKSKKKVYRIKQ